MSITYIYIAVAVFYLMSIFLVHLSTRNMDVIIPARVLAYLLAPFLLVFSFVKAIIQLVKERE